MHSLGFKLYRLIFIYIFCVALISDVTQSFASQKQISLSQATASEEAYSQLFDRLSWKTIALSSEVPCRHHQHYDHITVKLKFLNRGQRVLTSSEELDDYYTPPRLWDLSNSGTNANSKSPLRSVHQFGEITISSIVDLEEEYGIPSSEPTEVTSEEKSDAPRINFYDNYVTVMDYLNFEDEFSSNFDKKNDHFIFKNIIMGKSTTDFKTRLETHRWNQKKSAYQKSQGSLALSNLLSIDDGEMVEPERNTAFLSSGEAASSRFYFFRTYKTGIFSSLRITFDPKLKQKVIIQQLKDLPTNPTGNLSIIGDQAIYVSNGAIVIADYKFDKKGKKKDWQYKIIPKSSFPSHAARNEVTGPPILYWNPETQQIIHGDLGYSAYNHSYYLISLKDARIKSIFSDSDIQSWALNDEMFSPQYKPQFFISPLPDEILLLRFEKPFKKGDTFVEKSLNRYNLRNHAITPLFKYSRENYSASPDKDVIVGLGKNILLVKNQKDKLTYEYSAIDTLSGKVIQSFSFDSSEELEEFGASKDLTEYAALVKMKPFSLKVKYFSPGSNVSVSEKSYSRFTEGLLREVNSDVDFEIQNGMCEQDQEMEEDDPGNAPDLNSPEESYTVFPNLFSDQVTLNLKIKPGIDLDTAPTRTYAVVISNTDFQFFKPVFDQRVEFKTEVIMDQGVEMRKIETVNPILTSDWPLGLYDVKVAMPYTEEIDGKNVTTIKKKRFKIEKR